MSIILSLGRTVQAHLRQYGEHGPGVVVHCGRCGCGMQRHGRYWRWVVMPRRMYHMPVYRRRCPQCKGTCSLLPDFLRPYARFVTLVREGVLRRRLRGRWSWGALAEKASSFTVGLLSEKTLRRWLAGARQVAGAWGQFLAQYILQGWPATDVFSLTRRRDGVDAALHFLLEVGDWYRRQVVVQAGQHPGLFAALNHLVGAPPPL